MPLFLILFNLVLQWCSYELFLVGVCVVDVLEVDWKLAFSGAELL